MFGYDQIVTKLINLRKKNKKTQQEVADFLGITKQSYYKYEKKINKISLETIIKLSNYYRVSSDYFLKNNMEVIDDEIVFQEDYEFAMNVNNFLSIFEKTFSLSMNKAEIKTILANKKNMEDLKSEIIISLNEKITMINYLIQARKDKK